MSTSLELSALELELMRVQNQAAEAIVLGDLGGDVYGTLVAEAAAEFEVVEGEDIVGRLSPTKTVVSWCSSKLCNSGLVSSVV